MAAPSGTPAPAVTTASGTGTSRNSSNEEPVDLPILPGRASAGAHLPDRSPIGRFVHPSKEIVRFNVHTSPPFRRARFRNCVGIPEPAPMRGELHGPVRARWECCRSITANDDRERLRAKDTTLSRSSISSTTA